MIDFEEYKADMLGQGFDEVAVRTWPAANVQEMHGHPFAVSALVVEGEMWLTVGDATLHLGPGDTFALDRQQQHAERYGDAGATYWAARRH